MDSMIPMGQQMAVPKTSQTEMMISRQAQEVQGAGSCISEGCGN